MKIFDGKYGWLIILSMVAFVYFVFKRGTLDPTTHKVRVAALKDSSSPKQEILTAPAKQDSSRTFEQAKKNYNITVLNGITKVPVQIKNEMIQVVVQPKPEAQWCKSGDFDLIKLLAPDTQQRFLTLSLESINAKGLKRHQSFNLSDLNSGKNVSFDITIRDGAYGLYLCSDQRNSKSCASKRPVPAKIWSASGEKVKKLGENRIFYFQLLYVKDRTLHIIPSQAWGKDNLKSLKERLGDWMGEDVAALEKMDNLISKVRPMPARLANTSIELPLPYNDMRCLGK